MELAHIISAFNRATGVRKYLILSAPFGCAAIYETCRALLTGVDVMLPVLPVWELAAFAMLFLLVLWFFQRIVQLEAEKRPKITIDSGHDGSYRHTWDNKGSGGTTFNISLRNIGDDILNNCKVNVEKIYSEDGAILMEKSIPLRNVSSGDEIFTLRGGEKIFFTLFATLNGGFVRGKYYVGYHNSEYYEELKSGNYEFVVCAYSEKGGPTRTVIDVSLGDDGTPTTASIANGK